jgi:hypothetical protein
VVVVETLPPKYNPEFISGLAGNLRVHYAIVLPEILQHLVKTVYKPSYFRLTTSIFPSPEGCQGSAFDPRFLIANLAE